MFTGMFQTYIIVSGNNFLFALCLSEEKSIKQRIICNAYYVNHSICSVFTGKTMQHKFSVKKIEHWRKCGKREWAKEGKKWLENESWCIVVSYIHLCFGKLADPANNLNAITAEDERVFWTSETNMSIVIFVPGSLF